MRGPGAAVEGDCSDSVAQAEERARQAERRAAEAEQAVMRSVNPGAAAAPDARARTPLDPQPGPPAAEPPQPGPPLPEPRVRRLRRCPIRPRRLRPPPAGAHRHRRSPAAARAAGSGSWRTIELNTRQLRAAAQKNLWVTQATRLLAHRERLGGFQSVDDLDQVAGFPQDVLEDLKRRSRLSDPRPLASVRSRAASARPRCGWGRPRQRGAGASAAPRRRSRPSPRGGNRPSRSR